jgi:serine/threonine protein kinase
MDWLSDKTISHLREVTELPDLGKTKYRCLERIASGGMGTVYLAEDAQLKRNIALKILDIPDPEGQLAARMLQEAHVIAALEHPSIVPIHDVGTLPDRRVFYTMKFVKGNRLDEYRDHDAALPVLLRVLEKVCEGVAFAHAHKVIHRDLKPENIMVGDFGEVLVMDWGLAKLLSLELDTEGQQTEKSAALDSGERAALGRRPPGKSGSLTEHGTVMGTPAYMAPEQQRGDIGQIDERTDIYALGAILDFLTARTQGDGEEDPKQSRVFRARFVDKRPQNIPKQLRAISAKAMSEQKSNRYENALAMRDDIERYLNGDRVAAYEENILEIVWRKMKQNKFLIFLILTYILAQLVVRLLGQL